MSKIFLHIGLHKTATKFYQHHVFPFLDKEKFNYNPTKITQYLSDYIKAETSDKEQILKHVIEEKENLKQADERTIIISREIMSGNLFSAYRDWNEQVKLLHDMFPEAEIVISFRYQPDWLVSCYRESVHEHHYQSIEDFLNINNEGEFIKPDSDVNSNGFANLYALNLDYAEMLKSMYSFFDKNKVLTLFFEDFKSNQEIQVGKVLAFIGSDMIKIKPAEKIPNRGYSASSIKMSIDRYKKYKGTEKEVEIHRPIFFFGPNSIPAGSETLSVLDKDKYWGPQFLRDNEEVRSKNYPNLSSEEQIQLENSWRYRVKNIIDVQYYFDWDLLKDYRESLNSWYSRVNGNLHNILTVDIPDIYIKK